MRAALLLAAGLSIGSALAPRSAATVLAAAQPTGPTACQWAGRATKPPERLGSAQFVMTMVVDRDLGQRDVALRDVAPRDLSQVPGKPDASAAPAGAAPSSAAPAVPPPGRAAALGERSVIVNSTYGATYYRPFDIKAGTEIEVSGYVRAGDQCVVDTLNVGTVAPGFEGYVRPRDSCPTAGEETIAVYEKATHPLGCAVAPMFTAPTPLQRFQGGVMLNLKGMYVLQYGPASLRGVPLDGGTWFGARDTYRDPEPASLGLAAPEGFVEPKLGFGKTWREGFGGPDGPLGWALEEEAPGDASWQLFERGIVVVTRAGEGLILYRDARVWEYRLR